MEPLKLDIERRATRDRRRFSYTAYSPERRSGCDRRLIATRQSVKQNLRKVG